MTNELDKLKNAWESVSSSNSSKSFTSDELKQIVKKRSNNEISKIRRKIITEWAISLMLSLGLIGYVYFVDSAKTLWVALYIFIIFLVGLIPYLKVVRFSHSGGKDLKQHLTSYIAAFDHLVHNYVKINTFLIPTALLFAYMFGIMIGATLDNVTYQFKLMDVLLGVVVVASVTFLGYVVLRRYFSWIYGKNMKRLKECLADLSRSEE